LAAVSQTRQTDIGPWRRRAYAGSSNEKIARFSQVCLSVCLERERREEKRERESERERERERDRDRETERQSKREREREKESPSVDMVASGVRGRLNVLHNARICGFESFINQVKKRLAASRPN
jgi:hypothetical protein